MTAILHGRPQAKRSCLAQTERRLARGANTIFFPMRSNHRESIFVGTTNKGKKQIVKKAVEHPKLLAIEGCNWGYHRLMMRDGVASDAILYRDPEIQLNPENAR